MAQSIPRLYGTPLKMLSGILHAPTGAALRRKLAELIVERKLERIDLAAEGEPAPFFQPPSYRRDK